MKTFVFFVVAITVTAVGFAILGNVPQIPKILILAAGCFCGYNVSKNLPK